MPLSAAVAAPPARSWPSLCACLRRRTRRLASRGSRCEDDDKALIGFRCASYRFPFLQATADVSACAGFDVTLTPSASA